MSRRPIQCTNYALERELRADTDRARTLEAIRLAVGRTGRPEAGSRAAWMATVSKPPGWKNALAGLPVKPDDERVTVGAAHSR